MRSISQESRYDNAVGDYEIVEIDVFGFKIVEIVEAAPSEVLSTSGHVTV
jgi:hypothetical protein